LIESNSDVTREYVLSALNPIEESLNDLHSKIDKLLPTSEKLRETQKLPDLTSKGFISFVFIQ
jgi:hypothetical protein